MGFVISVEGLKVVGSWDSGVNQDVGRPHHKALRRPGVTDDLALGIDYLAVAVNLYMADGADLLTGDVPTVGLDCI